MTRGKKKSIKEVIREDELDNLILEYGEKIGK